MEQTPVLIVGAGPTGLVLGLSLAKLKIHSVILEKDLEPTTDPRGLFLTGDAVRVLYDLGVGHELKSISHEVHAINFHRTNLNTSPFFTIHMNGPSDALQQAVPEAIMQVQPRLEAVLRATLQDSQYCTLRLGCTVTSRSPTDPPIVAYTTTGTTSTTTTHQIQCQYLIGADGKLGTVRKHFLEPTAGIRQLPGVHPYNGTWIASNLQITLPTPTTHPTFPLWTLGYSPEQVYDLFWPPGWHFCTPPGKPTASGRFGPHTERLWRHEFQPVAPSEENRAGDAPLSESDAEAFMWEHLTPMITLTKDLSAGKPFLADGGAVTYPRDCIRILRCRPFRFTHRVVNKWSHGRTILIGDAAHVFPPFAGQGIASGVRDAHQLAWRLALLLLRKTTLSSAVVQKDDDKDDGRKGEGNEEEEEEEEARWAEALLQGWATERRSDVDDAARLSVMSGQLVASPLSWILLVVLFLQQAWNALPISALLPKIEGPVVATERAGLTRVRGGASLAGSERGYNGGARLAQIYVRSAARGEPMLSDRLLASSEAVFSVVVVGSGREECVRLIGSARSAIRAAGLDAAVLAEDSVVVYCTKVVEKLHSSPGGTDEEEVEIFYPVPDAQLKEGGAALRHDVGAYVERLGKTTRFAIVRPDMFTWACARDVEGFVHCLTLLKRNLGSGHLGKH